MTEQINKEKNLINPALPPGVKDILPVEARELKLIKKKLAKVYEAWGYDEVFTPAFEYLDVLSLQSGKRIQKEMFKFFDDRGDLLALRPDMTTSIARLVSQKLNQQILPLRLYYQANVFRQQKPLQGQPREFWQSGIELIGGSKLAADAEIITVLIEALSAVKLRKFKIGIGNIAFVKTLLDGLGSKNSQKLKQYLSRKDLVAVDDILTSSKASAAKKLKLILSLKGDKALAQAKKLSLNEKEKRALAELSQLDAILKNKGQDECITYDFSLVPDFDYYSGLVFEVYAEGIGLPVASGGRYDNLLLAFGWEKEAAGFAFSLERLHEVLVRERKINA